MDKQLKKLQDDIIRLEYKLDIVLNFLIEKEEPKKVTPKIDKKKAKKADFFERPQRDRKNLK